MRKDFRGRGDSCLICARVTQFGRHTVPVRFPLLLQVLIMLNNPGNFVSQTPNTSGSFNSSRGGRPQPKRGRGGMRGSPAATSSRSTSPEFKVPAVPTQVLPPSAGGYGPSPGYLPAQSPISGPSNAVFSPLTSIGPTAWAVPGTSSPLAGPSYQPSGSTSHISGNSNAAGSNTSAITTSAGALAYLSAPGGPLTPTVAAAVQSRLQSLGTGGLPSHVAVPSQNDVEEEGDDEMLPAMAEDDYSAQASWQTQSKDNLRYVSLRPSLHGI
jgi:hypothetical protein